MRCNMSILLELSKQDEELFKTYAEKHKMSLNDFIVSTVFERIEDEYDLQVYKQAYEEYKKDPVSYSHEEVCEMLGLNDDL